MQPWWFYILLKYTDTNAWPKNTILPWCKSIAMVPWVKTVYTKRLHWTPSVSWPKWPVLVVTHNDTYYMPIPKQEHNCNIKMRRTRIRAQVQDGDAGPLLKQWRRRSALRRAEGRRREGGNLLLSEAQREFIPQRVLINTEQFMGERRVTRLFRSQRVNYVE